MVQWDSSYETGEENIDRQHQILFSQLDKLAEVLDDENVAAQLPGIINYLKMYVDSHFTYEELSMFRHQCPVADENKVAHEKFKEAITNFENRVHREGPSVKVANEMHEFLEGWLKGHICKIDVQLKPCLRQNP